MILRVSIYLDRNGNKYTHNVFVRMHVYDSLALSLGFLWLYNRISLFASNVHNIFRDDETLG